MLHQHLWPDTVIINSRGHLTIGGCDLAELASMYGTPLYLLDEATFRNACQTYLSACARGYRGPAAVHYASKALLNVAIARIVAAEGLGLDAASGGELHVALQAGFPAERIHLHGNAKPQAELEQALAANIGAIVVDSLDELTLLALLTTGRSAPQPIMLRLAPDIPADTHAHIETGRASAKFGLPLDALDAAAARIAAAPGLQLVGLHAHLGSQIFDYAPIVQAISVLLDCAARLRECHAMTITVMSPGGGLGTPYTPDQPAPDYTGYAAALGGALDAGCAARQLPLPRLVIEPGRSIVARAGVALYTIVATKPLARTESAVRYLHIDGGMGDNIRPALYGARYAALLANRAAAPPEEINNISGRYCESGDILLRDVALPRAAPGDLLAVAVAGAYTLSMASAYNLVPRPPLLLLNKQSARLIQRRETYADLMLRDV